MLAEQSKVLTKIIIKVNNDLRVELVEVMKSGFANCATTTEMEEVKESISGLEIRVGGLETEVGSLKANIGSLEQRFTWMSGAMVTKDYLDDRMRAYGMLEDVKHKQHSQKTARLVQVLHTKKRLTRDEANVVLAMAPHPQKLLSK